MPATKRKPKTPSSFTLRLRITEQILALGFPSIDSIYKTCNRKDSKHAIAFLLYDTYKVLSDVEDVLQDLRDEITMLKREDFNAK